MKQRDKIGSKGEECSGVCVSDDLTMDTLVSQSKQPTHTITYESTEATAHKSCNNTEKIKQYISRGKDIVYPVRWQWILL